MALIICVSGSWQKRQYYEISNTICEPAPANYEIRILPKLVDAKVFTNSSVASGTPSIACPIRRTLRRKQVTIDGIQLYYLLKELLYFNEYKRVLCARGVLDSVELLWLQVIPPIREIIDWKW